LYQYKKDRERMASSGMLRRVALVRNDVSGELSSYIIKVTRIGEVGTLAVIDYCHPDEGGAKFLLHVGSYKSRTA
jgi:hypothetical protein